MGGRGSGSGRGGGGALPKEEVKEMLYKDFMSSAYDYSDTIKGTYDKGKKTILVKTQPRIEAVEKLIPESTMRENLEIESKKSYPNLSIEQRKTHVDFMMHDARQRRNVANQYYSVLENAAMRNKKLNKKNPSWLKKAYKIVKG